MFFSLTFFLIAALAPQRISGNNVTVDDPESSITYSPASSWLLSAPNSLDFGGAHRLTQDPMATATINFTGIAIYYFSPLWPYSVNTALSLDAAPPVLVDLVDHSRPDVGSGPETVQSAAVWSATGLSNSQHTLVVSVGAGQSFAVVDGFIYTTVDGSTSALTTTTGRTVASSTPSSGSTPKPSTHILPIALGTVLGVIGLLIIVNVLWFFCRRRRRPISEAWTVDGHPSTPQMASPSAQYTGSYANPYASATATTAQRTMQDPRFGRAGPAYTGSDRPPHQNTRWFSQQNQWSRAPDNRAPNRYVNQPNTLSTITETSTPTYGEGRTPLASSPASHQTELGYQSPAQVEGSDRLSSVGSDGRPGSSYYGPPRHASDTGGSNSHRPTHGPN